jgi:hypothetical protein
MTDGTDDDAVNSSGAADGVSVGASVSVDPKAPEPPIGDAEVLVTEEICGEVSDALELCDFIVKTGTRKSGVQALKPEIVKVIKVTVGKIRLFETAGEPVHIMASEWTRFELAYYALVEFSSPVTVETLRNTRNTGHGGIRLASPAQKFTWLLWFLTMVFAVIVIACGAVSTGADNSSPRLWAQNLRVINNFVPIIVPWVYGGSAPALIY